MNKKFLRARRKALLRVLPEKTVLLHSGLTQYRNITAGGYPFRSNSHCLYFFGHLPPRTVVLFGNNKEIVFWPFPTVEEIVWEGSSPGVTQLRAQLECDDIRPLGELQAVLRAMDLSTIRSLPSLQSDVNAELQTLLGRKISLDGVDRELAEAIVEVRLSHDDGCLSELRMAATATAEAFRQGLLATRVGGNGYEVLAAMEATCLKRGMRPSFSPTVTTSGETLHCSEVSQTLRDGELLLVDFGAETASGFAGDVTRTWPVNGKWSGPQRDIYQLVLAMQQKALKVTKPGVYHEEVHLAASRCLLEGLINLKVFTGQADSLLERGAHTLFFPHGIGHLIGLDVHDMEDLGDIAGYEPGKVRDTRFGFNSLRLQRKLRPNMLISNEPGFYWIPAILEDKQRLEAFRDCFSLEAAMRYRSIRGIRIEDEVLVTATGAEYFTPDIPREADEIERLFETSVKEVLSE